MTRGKPESLSDGWESLFSGICGIWLAVTLIKFGNPVILQERVSVPTSQMELLLSPWPINWGWWVVGVVVLLGVRMWRWTLHIPLWFAALPAVWLFWQLLSAAQTIDPKLTVPTIYHFVCCVLIFYTGLFAFSRVGKMRPFWIGILGGFAVVLMIGWRQHFGGFEETRRYFYSLPDWQSFPLEFIHRISSDRVYSTLFYPNALAGLIILLLPLAITVTWQATIREETRWVGIVLFAVIALGCLYWSGSKAGWLIALAQGILAIFHLSWPRRWKVLITLSVIAAGLLAFWLKHQVYFDKGATSFSARLDYWQAGWETLAKRPLLGSGPGTFGASYKAIKPAEAEMTKLAHNDFLQQGSDSGWPGLFAYSAWLLGVIGFLYRKRSCNEFNLAGALCLGLAGFAGHSSVEFGLYIPALAWPVYFLSGWALGRLGLPRNGIDKAVSAS